MSGQSRGGEARLRVEVGQADQHLLGGGIQELCARVVPQDRKRPHRVGQRLLVELLHVDTWCQAMLEHSTEAAAACSSSRSWGLWAGQGTRGRGRSSTRMSTMPRAAAASSSWGSG